ncbi:MAG: hypothetical protein JSW55_04345 [Chloroflexota bacterium]|nr:MAG: hypothetical protein JSW55_04345 [Chloroflexota bacterium]
MAQVNIWLLAPIVIWYELVSGRRRQQLLYLVIPLAAFGYLVWIWQGTTPPEFQASNASGVSPAAITYVLALFGLMSVFCAGYLWPVIRSLTRRDILVLAGIGAGAFLWILMLPTRTMWAPGVMVACCGRPLASHRCFSADPRFL